MRKVTLQVNGQEMQFSKEELAVIVEKYLASEAEKKALEQARRMKKPTEGEWFEVNPTTINPIFFKGERKDEKQEKTRWLITQALMEVRKKPEKYGKKFETMMPKKTWRIMTVAELEAVAWDFGGEIANWVEQALEWAQRINNGESWENVCNDVDDANWYRVVIWKNGKARLVGGLYNYHVEYSATDVDDYEFLRDDKISSAVPLVRRYK